MTKLDWSSFRERFGTYGGKIKPFFDAGGMDHIYGYLKQQKAEGKVVVPDSQDTFRCFVETPIEKLKVVMLGLCPYHTERGGVPNADGLLMSSSRTQHIQPSLDIFFKAVEQEMKGGLCLEFLPTPDLSYLAHQGVLMFNAALTTEMGKAGKHQELWEPFTKHVFETIIAPSMVPVIFLGKEAAKFKRYLATTQWSFELYHPAYAARIGEPWDTQGAFTKVGRILHDKGELPIEWLNIQYHEL